MSKSMLREAFCLDNENIISLRMSHGWSGYGIYCAILQLLDVQRDGTMTADFDRLAFHLQADLETVRAIVEDFGLFGFEDDGAGSRRFFSAVLRDDAERRAALSAKRAEAASRRWQGKKQPQSPAAAPKADTQTVNTASANAAASAPVKEVRRKGSGFNMVAGRALMLEDTEWFDKLSARYGCSRDVMKRMFNMFVDNLEMNGGGEYPSPKEAMNHFFNWLNKDYAARIKTRLMNEEKSRREAAERERRQDEERRERDLRNSRSITYEEYCRRNNIATTGSLADDLSAVAAKLKA